MVKQMHQRAGGKEQVRKNAKQVRSMLGPQEECCDEKKSGEHPFADAGGTMSCVMLLCVFHG
jgi:hypothetical protein